MGYAQVFKSRVNDVYDRLDEKFSEHQIEEEARGENLKEQVNEAKADISKAEKVAFSYSRAVSGAGEAGRPFLQAAIQKNNDLLENSYKRLKALETEYSEWQNQFYELNQTAKILSFEKAKRAPDFLEYSLLGLSRENPSYEDASGLSLFGWRPFSQKINNKVEFAVKNKDMADLEQIDQNPHGIVSDLGNITYMTDEERAIYAYWLEKEGEEKSEEYLEALMPALNKRATEDLYDTLTEAADENKAGGLILNLGSSYITPAAYLDTARQWIKNKLTGEYEPVDPYSPAHSASWMVKATQEGLTRDIESPFWKFVAETGLSVGQYLSKLPLGPGAALFVMSSGAAGMTATEAAARGATADQVMTLGTMAGAAEYLTEKIPLNDLFKIFGAGRTAAKQSLRQIARQAGEEGLEEFISEYVNTVSDNLVMGDLSQMNAYINRLVAAGVSLEEAQRQAKNQFFIYRPLMAAAGGALSGTVMAGTGTAWSNAGAYWGQQMQGTGSIAGNDAPELSGGGNGGQPGSGPVLPNDSDADMIGLEGSTEGAGDVGKIITKIEYTPSSGAILKANPNKTTTILGSFDKDMKNIVNEMGNVKSTYFGAKKGGFNVLNVPDDMYKSADQFWNEVNKPWLDEVINRGDDIVLATKPTGRAISYIDINTGKEKITGFGREYKYLLDNGYSYDALTNMMIKK